MIFLPNHDQQLHDGRRRIGCTCIIAACLLFLMDGCSIFKIPVVDATATESTTVPITPNSTVLVTGAAGFLGSQVSLAILRLYSPKHLILLDNFESTYMHDGSSSSPPFAGTAFTSAEYLAKFKQEYNLHKTQQFLTLMEYKRQRMFTILQSCVTTRTTHCQFYKADLRPTIPEYFDTGEIPLLNHIFEQYKDITHVLHLANEENSRSKLNKPPGRNMLQSTKAGMTETMLEQLRKENKKRQKMGKPTLQYVFRSSYEVYRDAAPDIEDEEEKLTTDPSSASKLLLRHCDEVENITSPANLHGTYKRIDEILARAYAEEDSVPSVGLRLFPLYGPWDSSPLFSSASASTVTGATDASAPLIAEGRGLDVFSLCERIVSLDPMEPLIPLTSSNLDDATLQHHQNEWKQMYQRLTRKHDFVFIDDAVDAVLSALQFPMASTFTTWPIIFNVGGGTTTGASIADIIHIMEQIFPRSIDEAKFEVLLNRLTAFFGDDSKVPTARGVLANITRAQYFLNYKPRVSLQQGILRTLSWHHDRLHPYGLPMSYDNLNVDELDVEKDTDTPLSTTATHSPPESLLSSGIAACSPLDKECLQGSAVFPCVSECANRRVCLPSIYDHVIPATLELTMGCSAVMYTVLLGKNITAEDLPNASVAVSSDAHGFFADENGGKCNLAFVTEGSKILTELDPRNSPKKAPSKKLGIWELVPVPHISWSISSLLEEDEEIISLFASQEAQMLIPKLSPGIFFASTVKYAVYVKPNVVISDVNAILNLMNERPRGGGMAGMNSGISMLLLQNLPPDSGLSSNPWSHVEEDSLPDIRGAQQESAYQSIQIGLHGQILLNIPHGVDSSFVVHSLQLEDARLLRCDVYAEVLQWESFREGEAKSLEFVLGLHNLWSRLIMQWAGYHPWWEDENAEGAADGALSQTEPGGSAPSIDQILRENLESFNKGDLDGTTATDDSVEGKKKTLTEAAASAVRRSKWFAVLSSKVTHQFVRIVPADIGLVMKLT